MINEKRDRVYEVANCVRIEKLLLLFLDGPAMMFKAGTLVLPERIERSILWIRGQKVRFAFFSEF
jgi:hypothetical protein